MASIGRKDGMFHVRFRFNNVAFKKSLKTRDAPAARAALHIVELALYQLLTGQIVVPAGTNVGDFIISGGRVSTPAKATAKPALPPTLRALADQYAASQKSLLAPSYLYSQSVHLRHLARFLGGKADQPCRVVGYRDLDDFLKTRLETRHANTVERERITLLQFFRWVVQRGYLDQSPALGLAPIKGDVDRPPFRTVAEIQHIVERGGRKDAEVLDLWECLYLNPVEIGGLLALVKANAKIDYGHLLHAIPAYTGMRRGEVLRLQWVDVDLAEGFICARSRKQSRSKRETVRRIDMHEELKQELLDWKKRRPRGQFVVSEARTLEPINNDRSNRVFWQPMRHTEWCLNNTKDWFKIGFHTYRHSFASNLAAAGVDQRVIDEFMGHSTEAMRRRYRHLFPKQRRSAIESFSLALSIDDRASQSNRPVTASGIPSETLRSDVPDRIN
jgi:integrase